MKLTIYRVGQEPLIVANVRKVVEISKTKIAVYREGQPPIDLKPNEVTSIVTDPNY